MRPAASLDTIEKCGAVKETARQAHLCTELAIRDRSRCLRADDTTRPDREFRTAQTATGMDDHTRRDTVRVDVRRDVVCFRRKERDPAHLKLV